MERQLLTSRRVQLYLYVICIICNWCRPLEQHRKRRGAPNFSAVPNFPLVLRCPLTPETNMTDLSAAREIADRTDRDPKRCIHHTSRGTGYKDADTTAPTRTVHLKTTTTRPTPSSPAPRQSIRCSICHFHTERQRAQRALPPARWCPTMTPLSNEALAFHSLHERDDALAGR